MIIFFLYKHNITALVNSNLYHFRRKIGQSCVLKAWKVVSPINKVNDVNEKKNSNSFFFESSIENETQQKNIETNNEDLNKLSMQNYFTNIKESILQFYGMGLKTFSDQVSQILMSPINDEDIEVKPEGLLYLPEIKYRRILLKAFGPGGWGLLPISNVSITSKQVNREYGLICQGRLISISRGEQDYFGGEEKLATALEGCKSNALMRCCKDIGIASELWDPVFIKSWKKKFCDEVMTEHVVSKKRKIMWKLKKNSNFNYPYRSV